MPKRDGWLRIPWVSTDCISPTCKRRIHLPFISRNALIYGIHMVTLPRPQPPQIPQACWRLRLEPEEGGSLAQHTSFIHSLAHSGLGRGRQHSRDPGALYRSHPGRFSSSCNLVLVISENYARRRAAGLPLVTG